MFHRRDKTICVKGGLDTIERFPPPALCGIFLVLILLHVII